MTYFVGVRIGKGNVVTSQDLELFTVVGIPYSTSAVDSRSNYFCTLRIKLTSRYLPIMPIKLRNTSPSIHIIQPRLTISTSRHDFRPSRIKTNIQHLILRPQKTINTLPSGNIPNLAGPINATSSTILPCEFKLCRRYLAFMLCEGMNAHASPHVPDLGSAVE